MTRPTSEQLRTAFAVRCGSGNVSMSDCPDLDLPSVDSEGTVSCVGKRDRSGRIYEVCEEGVVPLCLLRFGGVSLRGITPRTESESARRGSSRSGSGNDGGDGRSTRSGRVGA